MSAQMHAGARPDVLSAHQKIGPRIGGPKGWAHPDQKKNRFSKRHPIGRAEFAISRRVRNVMDHLSTFTGGTQCCQSQRAAPAIL